MHDMLHQNSALLPVIMDDTQYKLLWLKQGSP